MKKITVLLMICSISLSFGQTFTLSTDTIEETYADYEYAYDYIYLNNTSGVALSMNFTLLSNTCVTNGWYNTLCTSYTCYPNVPTSGTLGSIPNGGQGYFRYHVGFDGISGNGTLRIRVYENGNPSNADTLTYIYHVYSTTGLENADTYAGIILFPNPVVDILNIQSENIYENGFIEIKDISGKIIVRQPFLSDYSSIQLTDFPNGIYFTSIYSGDHQVYTGKFLKK